MRSRKNSFLLSSNVNEVIREILNFFFYEKILRAQKAQNACKRTKRKKDSVFMRLKHLRGRKSPIRLLALRAFCVFCALCASCAFCIFCVFCAFAWFRLCVFMLFVRVKPFRKKNKRSLKLSWWPHLHYYCDKNKRLIY